MTSITFDTHKFIRKLKEVGIPENQAEVLSDAIKEAQNESLVTKQDLEITLAPIKSDINLIKWMLGILLAGVISLILKSFF